MRIDGNMAAETASREIASRIKQYRIMLHVTQEELADKAYISVGTLKRFEAGEDVSFQKLIRILAALGLTEKLDFLIPDQSIRPSMQLQAKPRKRAVKDKPKAQAEWKWGDEN